MKYVEFANEIFTMNQFEKFYKKCYFEHFEGAKNNIPFSNSEFEEIVKSHYPEKYVNSCELTYLPEEFMDESQFISGNEKNNIIIMKHNRYTPVFYHKHSFFEFIVVLKGTCEHYINNTTITIKVGDMCLVPPNVYHSLSVFSDCVVLNVLIRRKFFENILFEFFDDDNAFSNFIKHALYNNKFDNYLSFHTDNDEDITALILDMYIEYQLNERFSKQIIENECVIVFSKLQREQCVEEKYGEVINTDIDFSNELIRYIDINFADVTLEEVASHFNYAPAYASKKIKQTLGCTFNEILRKIKINKAKQLLVNTGKSIIYISEYLGYRNSENFIRIFKRETGESPVQYRENKKGRYR